MSLDLSKYEGHTPGPWKKSGRPSGYDWCKITSGRVHVATITHWSDSVNNQNTQLIADAPQLLAEVKELRSLIREMNEHEGAEGWSADLAARIKEVLSGLT